MQTKKTNSEVVEIKVNFDLDDGYRALDKLALVVHDLAVGKGRIKDLLFEVGRDILDLREKDFPEDLRSDFLWIREAITEKPAKMETVPKDGEIIQKSTGSFVSTLRSMRNEKASIIAERICLLYEEVRIHCYQSRPGQVRFAALSGKH